MIPDLAIPGLPPWLGTILFLGLCLAALAFLLMPFAVFGLKGRMEALESQMEAIRDELAELRRAISQGAPLAPPASAYEADTLPGMQMRRVGPSQTGSAPVPPPPVRPPRQPRDAEGWAGRREPRL